MRGHYVVHKALCQLYLRKIEKKIKKQINRHQVKKNKIKSEDTAPCVVMAELQAIWPPWADSSGTHRGTYPGSEGGSQSIFMQSNGC